MFLFIVGIVKCQDLGNQRDAKHGDPVLTATLP